LLSFARFRRIGPCRGSRTKKTGPAARWFTKAVRDACFGNVDALSFMEARHLSNGHIKSLSENQDDSKRKDLAARDPVELFRAWVEKNRGKDTCDGDMEMPRTHIDAEMVIRGQRIQTNSALTQRLVRHRQVRHKK
jgi:hypothetical protein